MRAVFAIPLWQQSCIQAIIAMIGAFLVCSCAVYYFRRFRLERQRRSCRVEEDPVE